MTNYRVTYIPSVRINSQQGFRGHVPVSLTCMMDKCLCESCFLWNILEHSMSLTHHKWIIVKMRQSTMWPELSGSFRMTCVQGMCHRSCIRNRGAVVYIWVMGQPQASEKWMILSKCCWFFFPSATVFYMSLSPFALLYSLLPVSAFKGLRRIISFVKNSCCSLFILFAFHNSSLASPLECVLTWQWWRGWMEGELHVVKCEHWHSKLWKK